MGANDEAEVMFDQVAHEIQRDALVQILDALAPLDRDDRIRVVNCACKFFGLPRE